MATYWKNLRPFRVTMSCQWMLVILILLLKFKASHLEGVDADEVQQPNVECPASSGTSACPCYKFEDGEKLFNSFNLSL